MKKNWYSIVNQSPDVAEISIYDEIGFFGVTAKSFLDELKNVGDRRIELHINSPGGDVFDGLAIYNRLKNHAPGVHVIIDGLAASMGSVIAMAGTTISMAENALMMIHNPTGFCMGESSDMRELAAMLDKVKSSIISTYSGRLTSASAKESKMSDEEIAALMDAETWFTAQEAKVAGFVDDITPGLKMAARFDTSKFRNAPTPRLTMNPLRASILTALALTETPDKPLADDAILAAFSKTLNDARSANEFLLNERDTIRTNFVAAQTKQTEAEGRFTSLLVNVKSALPLTEDQLGKVATEPTVLATAIETLATAKAVAIGASQGIPPVKTTPGQKAAESSMTVAEYRELPHADRLKFGRSGGKLIEA